MENDINIVYVVGYYGVIKMREQERIDRITNLINTMWKKTPDMRFGQLLINIGVMEDDMVMWNIEDDKWEEHLLKINKKW